MLRGRTYESGKGDDIHESKKVKRYRSAFTTNQINYLEKQFHKCPYIGSATRKEVANLLNIPERAIKIWFQNRRMKEKKETNGKEYNFDRHNNLTNNMEFAKDSLNNVHSSQSANDRQCSLQSNIETHDLTNCTTNYDNTACYIRNRNDNLKKGTVDNRKPYHCLINDIKQDADRTCISESANLMKHNLYKNYNNKNFVNYLELNKKNVTKSKVTSKTPIKSGSFRNSTSSIPSTQPQNLDLPEDLSPRNLSNVMIPQNQGNIHLPSAYIPYCNTQDVCLPAGNVIWKPVSVMPALSPNMPVAVSKQLNINHKDTQPCRCNCDCHFRSRLNYDPRNTDSQPQYVIAIPYNNNVKILR